MIWNRTVYDSLTNCATLCDEFATECSRSETIESQYRSVFLSLDCADMCRQLAMLYVRGSENAPLLAKACLEVCRKCTQELGKLDIERSQQVRALCEQAMLSCGRILDTAYHFDSSSTPARIHMPLLRGVNFGEIFHN